MALPDERWVEVRGLRLYTRQWPGQGTPFVLLHGLASNCFTWESVARHLHAAGHAVVTVDQRGHGRSAKPDSGYGFDDVTADLRALVDCLALGQRPVVAGQSWGANVALELAARYPDTMRGIVLVDGGIVELASRPGATWESVAVELRPPNLNGTPRAELSARLRRAHPDWSDEGIEHTLANFETLPDGTVRPWLSLERHMAILRALWEQRPSRLYARVAVPVLIVVADTGDEAWTERKRAALRQAEAGLARTRSHWLADTAHDVHVHRPDVLAPLMLAELTGLFASR